MGCRVQVVICGDHDRGHIYCARASPSDASSRTTLPGEQSWPDGGHGPTRLASLRAAADWSHAPPVRGRRSPAVDNSQNATDNELSPIFRKFQISSKAWLGNRSTGRLIGIF